MERNPIHRFHVFESADMSIAQRAADALRGEPHVTVFVRVDAPATEHAQRTCDYAALAYGFAEITQNRKQLSLKEGARPVFHSIIEARDDEALSKPVS